VKLAALLVAVAVGLLAGCGGDDDSTTLARVYFLRDGKVWPVARDAETDRVEAAALESLFDGPTSDERRIALDTAVPGGTPSLTIDDGVARFQPAARYPTRALAQIVYTLTQFEAIESVEIDGKRYTRADFEEQTPLILVESPVAYEEVTSPLRVTGTANTFEATFQYELKDAAGEVVDEHFVTATSGTGTRGTFDFTTKPFDDVGSLVVFELSAEDGSRVNEMEIPLRMSR
jgi:germination protein M